MASSSFSSSSSAAPKLIIPDDKPASDASGSRPSPTSSVPPATDISSSSGTATKKLTKILSTQSSFERHHPVHPIAKRFSIDADPSSIILNTPVTDCSNNHVAQQQQQPTPDAEEISSTHTSSPNIYGKETSPARSPSLKKSDSFLEIPYEKGEIVDLIKLVDDPNAATHITNDGHEVLLEHGAVPQ
ncbi:unnamed protein product [Rotaria sordida]|uniref:Uncharacterized protein n=2 Tax=Rotaria sordida TaxID=392033 RepID=A0A814Y3F4_9BILA|nr:unnamed protein product [Rotaria sordida]CAF1223774.1 unnamed protein product [Rotaria sordida]CAF3620538.1 unnamed protein product [Rotaria sordida]CAF3787595.1 unnamed protein product [Rotaria sordida]CAF3831738.1 unnamed protein product [Rotaria sordida]